MEASLFNEEAADKQVIKSLRSEIERLQIIIMSKIIKTNDGRFFKVNKDQELSAEEVTRMLAERQVEASELQVLLSQDQPAPVPTSVPTENQPQPEPVTEPAPVADQPAPAEVSSPSDGADAVNSAETPITLQ